MSAQTAAAARDPAAAGRQALEYATDPHRPRYCVGGVIFAASAVLPPFSGYATGSPCTPPAEVPDSELVHWQTRTTAHVIDRQRTVSLCTENGCTTLQIEGLGSHRVTHRGEIRSDEAADLQRWCHLLCGPLLPLALARRQRFQLHASAAVVDRRLLLICGLSGSGKSTLGRKLQQRGHDLVADDVITLNARPPLFAGAFPQPKWPLWGADVLSAARLPAKTNLIVLQPGAEKTPRLENLSASATTLALARHSVATRLFDPPLLRRHLGWCADLADTIDAYSLRYARQHDALEPMAKLLESAVVL